MSNEGINQNRSIAQTLTSKKYLFLFGALLLVCAAFLIIGAPNASAAGPTYEYGDITTNTAWTEAGSPYIVNDTITVNVGATLTIGPNVTVMVQPGNMIIVKGTIVADGTAALPITFTTNDTVTFVRWNGIEIQYTSTGSLFDNVFIDKAGGNAGITVLNATVGMTYVTVNNSYSGVDYQFENKAVSISVDNCNFTHMDYFGVRINGYAWAVDSNVTDITVPISITNSIFDGNGYGVDIWWLEANAQDNATAKMTCDISILNNTFEGSNSAAIYYDLNVDISENGTVVIAGDILIKGNTIKTSNYGFEKENDNDIRAEDTSDVMISGDISIVNNTFEDLVDDAIYLNTQVEYVYDEATVSILGDISISGNTFEDIGGSAIYCEKYIGWNSYVYDDAEATISGGISVVDNTIKNVDYGLYYQLYIDTDDNGTGSISGDVTVTGNYFESCGDDGIYVEKEGGSRDENSTTNMDVSSYVNNNQFWNCSSDAFYEYTYFESDGYGAISISGETIFSENVIRNIDRYVMEVERELYSYDLSELSSDCPYSMINNDVVIADELIDIYPYYYAYDESVMNITNENVVITGNTARQLYDYSLYAYLYYESYDDASLNVSGKIDFIDNDVNCLYDESAYIERYMDVRDDAIFNVLYPITIQDNVISVDDGDDYYAIYVYDVLDAYSSFNNTATISGDVTIENNQISIISGDGIYLYVDIDVETDDDYTSAIANYDVNYVIQDNEITVFNDNAWDYTYGIYAYLGCYLESDGDMGAASLTVGDVLIEGNTVSMSGESYLYGIYLYIYAESYSYGGDATLVLSEFSVTENTISLDTYDGYGIYLYYPYFYVYADNGNATLTLDSINVVGNSIDTLGDSIYGIYVYEPDFECYVYGGDWWYLNTATLEATNGFNIDDNTISMVGDYTYALYLEYVYRYVYSDDYWSQATVNVPISISGNSIVQTGLASYGIYLYYVDYDVYYDYSYATLIAPMEISDNTVEYIENDDYAYGLDVESIYLDLADPTYIGEYVLDIPIVISNNVVVAGYDGIYIYDSTDGVQVFVTGNTVSETTDYGLYVDDVEYLYVEDNVFSNNMGDGAYVEYLVNSVIGNNTFSENGEYGLYVDYGCEYLTIYNGVYDDNSYMGIYIYGGKGVYWVVDAASEIVNNDAEIYAHVEVRAGGVLTIDSVQSFLLGDGYDGVTLLKVLEGGKLIVGNSWLESDDGDGRFLIHGDLDMSNTWLTQWSELYLGPTATGSISASYISDNDKNGIHIDGCSPRISLNTISGNYMDGIFIEGASASPRITNNLITENSRGISARGCDLNQVIGNIFVGNDVAGLYAQNVTGAIHGNTFLMNRIEIYVKDSDVSIQSNEIGYARMIGALAKFGPVSQLLNNMSGNIVSGLMSTYLEVSSESMFNHMGIFAESSTVKASGNTYGMLYYAFYAEDSTVTFSDDLTSNKIVLSLLNANLEQVNISVPTYLFNGIYASNSAVEIKDSRIECMETAVFLDTCTGSITNCELVAERFDVYLTGDCDVSLSGTTLDGELKVEGSSTLMVYNWLDVITKNDDNETMSGVTVEIKDSAGTLISKGKSDDNGVYRASVLAYTVTSEGKNYTDAYKVTADFDNGKVSKKVTLGDSSVTELTIEANKDNTVLYVSIVFIIVVILLIVVVMVMRRKKKA